MEQDFYDRDNNPSRVEDALRSLDKQRNQMIGRSPIIRLIKKYIDPVIGADTAPRIDPITMQNAYRQYSLRKLRSLTTIGILLILLLGILASYLNI